MFLVDINMNIKEVSDMNKDINKNTNFDRASNSTKKPLNSQKQIQNDINFLKKENQILKDENAKLANKVDFLEKKVIEVEKILQISNSKNKTIDKENGVRTPQKQEKVVRNSEVKQKEVENKEKREQPVKNFENKPLTAVQVLKQEAKMSKKPIPDSFRKFMGQFQMKILSLANKVKQINSVKILGSLSKMKSIDVSEKKEYLSRYHNVCSQNVENSFISNNEKVADFIEQNTDNTVSKKYLENNLLFKDKINNIIKPNITENTHSKETKRVSNISRSIL